MLVIGECIHVISPRVRTAIEERDAKLIQGLAREQVAKGAQVLDLNIGPQRKAGPEVMTWIVNTVQDVVDVPLSLDTTNVAAIETGLKLVRKKAFINSTDATAERLGNMMPLAGRYKANIIALTLGATGLPTTTDARIDLASQIMPVATEQGVPNDSIYLDPLVLTINGNQDQVLNTVNAARFFKQMSDPAPKTTCGLSNVSNSCPKELRPLINRVFLLMMLGAGLDSAILDPLDGEIMEALHIVESRDTSTPKARLYLAIHDAHAAGELFDPSSVDASTPELQDIVKTVGVLENRTIYAHSYLRI